jgi:hypothetical protein
MLDGAAKPLEVKEEVVLVRRLELRAYALRMRSDISLIFNCAT